jgi:hypothetical protein
MEIGKTIYLSKTGNFIVGSPVAEPADFYGIFCGRNLRPQMRIYPNKIIFQKTPAKVKHHTYTRRI